MTGPTAAEIEGAQKIARRVAMRRMGGRAWEGISLEDVVQEVLLRFAALDLDEILNWEAWVTTATKNRCSDVTSAAERHNNQPIRPHVDGDGHAADLATRIGMWVVGPSAAAIHPLMLAHVMEALSDRERLVVTRHLDGWSNAEIAEEFGYASAASVAVTVSKAKRKMRDRFAVGSQRDEILHAQRPY